MSGGPKAVWSRARWAVPAVALVLTSACSSTASTTTPPPATSGAPSVRSAPSPATTAAPSVRSAPSPTTSAAARPQHFGTLPVGATLPGDAECAAQVRPAPEVRPANERFNQTRGSGPPANPPGPLFARVTGDFTGTTDEIIQWAACKWGIDEDIVRAQVAKESYWKQEAAGDFGTDASACAPGHEMGSDDGHPDQCAESIGLMQVRYPYWGWAFPDAGTSSAYNLDAALAARRNCFEGNDTWLNTTDRGKDYTAGDIWGCVGTWFAGRWYTDAANEYIAAVKDYLSSRIWERSDFVNDR